MRTRDEGCDITQQRNTYEMAANQILHVKPPNLLSENNNCILQKQLNMIKLFYSHKYAYFLQ
jgi:hypothetical protein